MTCTLTQMSEKVWPPPEYFLKTRRVMETRLGRDNFTLDDARGELARLNVFFEVCPSFTRKGSRGGAVPHPQGGKQSVRQTSKSRNFQWWSDPFSETSSPQLYTISSYNFHIDGCFPCNLCNCRPWTTSWWWSRQRWTPSSCSPVWEAPLACGRASPSSPSWRSWTCSPASSWATSARLRGNKAKPRATNASAQCDSEV